jgi:hypothetical protein
MINNMLLHSFAKNCDKNNINANTILVSYTSIVRGHRGRDRMVFGFTTTCVISAYHQFTKSLNPALVFLRMVDVVLDTRIVLGLLPCLLNV